MSGYKSTIQPSNGCLFTAIVAVYNVEEYLGAFLKSVEWQTIDPDLVEYIFVDDVSTDSSLEIISKWASGRENVQVVSLDQNSGPATVRNTGLDLACGKWVTSVDPDDILGREYFANVAQFLKADTSNECAAIATAVVNLQDGTGSYNESHPLGFKFGFGDRKVSLSDEPHSFLIGATTFLRRDELNRRDLRFDARVKPTFEDGNLISRYLLGFEDPVIGVVPSSRYFYRRRENSSSLVQSGWARPEKYEDQLRFGYLPLLAEAKQKFDGSTPHWLENQILYDLFWYFIEERNFQSKTAWVGYDPDVSKRFLGLVGEVLKDISAETVAKFSIQATPWKIREAILSYFYPNYVPDAVAYRMTRGKPSDLTIISRSNDLSRFSMVRGGTKEEVSPYAINALPFFGVNFAYEIRVHVKSTFETLTLDGEPVPVRSIALETPSTRRPDGIDISRRSAIGKASFRATRIRESVDIAALANNSSISREFFSKAKRKVRSVSSSKQTATNSSHLKSVLNEATGTEAREKYHDAWLIQDRPNQAGDNGEHLYRYILRNRPDINAYFVLNKMSPDWHRLEAEGFRLIEFGSDEVTKAYVNCSMVASSDATADVMYPGKGRRLPKPFVFLQHGTCMTDISRWINPKQIDAIFTSARSEFASFIADESPYYISREDVFLTGLARHDRLTQLAEKRERRFEGASKNILIFPSWRLDLRNALNAESTDEGKLKVLKKSKFFGAWSELLGSQRFSEFLTQNGARATLVLHPSFTVFKDLFSFGDDVEVVDISSIDFQSKLADSDAFITDFSSTIYDATYSGIPSAYYSFDYLEALGGRHSSSIGWWYNVYSEAVAPAFDDSEEVMSWLLELAETGWGTSEEYATRVSNEFPFRDSNNSQRILAVLLDRYPHSTYPDYR